MKLLHISDTHMYPLAPILDGFEADLLVHSGDALNSGSSKDWYRFLKDLEEVVKKFKYIIYCPGNHDIHVERCLYLCREELKNIGVTLLVDESVTIEGIKFYGSPWVPYIANMWAFEQPPLWNEEAYELVWKKVPNDIDVLITHTPPEGILAGPWGDPYLLTHVLERIKPQYHLFGHIHFAYNSQNINGIKFYNGALCSESYHIVNKPHLIEVERRK